MKKKSNRCLARVAILLLCAVLLFSLMTVCAVGAMKNVPTRAIAIVYDNSASMYGIGGDPLSWCRATYAIEVFASMLNAGDVLQVYPMHPIQVDGETYSRDGAPLIIRGDEDTTCIERIFTIDASGTPIETITDAFEGLKEVTADEHWLIVLTDGDFYYGNTNQKVPPDEVGRRLNLCNREVQTLYMGIGSGAASPEGFENTTMAKDSKEVLKKLTDICNQIFGRDTLAVQGKTISFDVSLSKLIVFVQGKNIQNVQVTDAAGRSVGTVLSTSSPHYSEMPFGREGETREAEVDENLTGQLITFENCAAGEYTLTFTGTSSHIDAYFEPDVDIQVHLLGENGEPINVGEELSAGTYEISYGLIDRITGEPVTSSLLKDTQYRIEYSTGTEQQTITDTEEGKFSVELLPGDVLDASFHVTFLKGYHIDRTGDDFGWPKFGIHITEREAGDLQLKLSGGAAQYKLSSLEEEAVYFAELYYNGEKLRGDGLENVELFPELNAEGLKYQVEKQSDGYRISLTHAGSAAETEPGEYALQVYATYHQEKTATAVSNTATERFHIEDDSRGLQIHVSAKQEYYQKAAIAEGEPIEITLNKDGAPLTSAEMQELRLTYDTQGLPYRTQVCSDESKILLWLEQGDQIETGDYQITVTAQTMDELGREISATESCEIEVGSLAPWQRTAIYLVILLLVLFIIWRIRSKKVLPKKMIYDTESMDFKVNGRTVQGAPDFRYTGGGKKRGSLTIRLPMVYSSPLLNAEGITLSLEAVSPRREKSKNRKVRVTEVTRTGVLAKNVAVGNLELYVEPRTNALVVADGTPETPRTTEMISNSICHIGGRSTREQFLFDITLIFK